MPQQVQKHIKVTQVCVDCQIKNYDKNHMVTVPADFKVSDIKQQLTTPENQCQDCKQSLTTKFSFYHEEKLTN